MIGNRVAQWGGRLQVKVKIIWAGELEVGAKAGVNRDRSLGHLYITRPQASLQPSDLDHSNLARNEAN